MPWHKAKFQHKSNRVKGLSFHPHRPWILASLHNGQIQLHDYAMELLIHIFEEHDGPVRSVDFHLSQPLFVSGGDDYKIKVWNYQLRRSLFSLTGHLDYIRTVQFHSEYPWIASSSDDQTIRIWNWQNRECLSVLTGHNHYVMCAQFHPTENLVLSASLDQTVRIWDIEGLCKKKVVISGTALGGDKSPGSGDLFGGSDVVVKHVLEGHSRGVNWASFHHSMPLVVSGADDREVKLWRMNETKAWEIDVMRGHTNNVSCVLFHPKLEYIISNSEDKSVRAWDISKQYSPKIWRRDHDRFWILAAHPRLNLVAAGHDSGFFVFKLNKERPAYGHAAGKVLVFKNKGVYEHEIKTGRETCVYSIRTSNYEINNSSPPRELHVNPHAHTKGKGKGSQVILFWEDTVANYELCIYDHRDKSSKKGNARSVAWVSRTKFAVLNTEGKVEIRNLKNEVRKTLNVQSGVNKIYTAGLDRLLLRTEDTVILYRTDSRKVERTCNIENRHPVKIVSWSEGYRYLALMSKYSIIVCDRNLNIIANIPETSKLKSGCWDNHDVFVYATTNHLKYALITGDHGIIRTINEPIYLATISEGTVTAVDREQEVKTFNIDTTEYMFKLALVQGKKKDITRIIQRRRLVGESIIGYLQQKGYPEIALQFVEDQKTKFSLALDCGDLKKAKECAEALQDVECWLKLGQVALEQGDFEIYGKTLGQTRSLDKLAFHFLLSGNRTHLEKLQTVCKSMKKPMSEFHVSLMLGNVEPRIRILEESGQIGLAYILAKNHNLSDHVLSLSEKLTDGQMQKLDKQSGEGRLIFPPKSIVPGEDWGDWPCLKVNTGDYWERLKADAIPSDDEADANDMDDHEEDSTEPDDLFEDELEGEEGVPDAPINEAEWDIDIDISEEEASSGFENDTDVMDTILPPAKKDFREGYTEFEELASQICSGDFSGAMSKMNRDTRISNFSPLQDAFVQCYQCSGAEIPGLSGTSFEVPMLLPPNEDEEEEEEEAVGLPAVPFNVHSLLTMRRKSWQMITDWKNLDEGLESFRKCLYASLFTYTKTKKEKVKVKEIQEFCSTYISAIRVMQQIKGEKDPRRALLLRMHFLTYDLHYKNKLLPLVQAINLANKAELYRTTIKLCHDYFSVLKQHSKNLPTKFKSFVKKIKKVMTKAQEQNTDAFDLGYDVRLDRDQQSLCPGTFTVVDVEPGKSFSSTFDVDEFSKKFRGRISPTCNLCVVGMKGTAI